MKFPKASLILIFFASAALCLPQSGQQQRPTLGPEPAPTLGMGPSLGGPMNAKIQNPAALRMVHTVYVGWIGNSLELKLIRDFSHGGPFRVVNKADHADAVLRGSCYTLPNLKDIHTEVYLTSKTGKPIWQDIVHIRYDPPTVKVSVTQSAQEIIRDLRASIEAAER